MSPEDSFGYEIPLKILKVDEERCKLLLSDLQTEKFTPGAIVTGKVETLKPYGAIINVSGLMGLLHISQISHHLVTDISAIFSPGDGIKVSNCVICASLYLTENDCNSLIFLGVWDTSA